MAVSLAKELSRQRAAKRLGMRYVPKDEPRRRRKSKRQERSDAWRDLRHKQREAKKDTERARELRNVRLVEAREVCEAERADVNQRCKSRRETIRAETNTELERIRRRRLEARRHYAWITGGLEPKSYERRYSKTESDSLAEHAIPTQLVPLWRELRGQFSYELAPDYRAERFLEWVQEHEGEVSAALTELYTPSDAELALAELEHHQQQATGPVLSLVDELDEDDEVPF